MSGSNFAVSLELVAVHEGGLVDHPRDPGGRTNRGVTQAVYNEYRASKGQVSRPVDNLTNAEHRDIYKVRYWDAVRGDLLPPGVDYATFDAGVNSGPTRALKWLQKALPTYTGAIDGRWGQKTHSAVNEIRDGTKVIKDLCKNRLGFVQALKTWSTFGRGWLRRITEVEAAATRMWLLQGTASPEVIHDIAKNEVTSASNEVKTNTTAAGGAAGTGGGVGAFSGLPTSVIIVLGVVVVVVVGYFLWRAKVQKERAKAFDQLAQEFKP